jgi:hypothetical protein
MDYSPVSGWSYVHTTNLPSSKKLQIMKAIGIIVIIVALLRMMAWADTGMRGGEKESSIIPASVKGWFGQ